MKPPVLARMQKQRSAQHIAIITRICVACVSTNMAVAQSYSIKSLGLLGSGSGYTSGQSINERGWVCGLAQRFGEGYTRPVLNIANSFFDVGASTDLGGAGWDLNESGEVVGEADFFDQSVYSYHAARWKSGIRFLLPDFGFNSEAEAINNSSRTVGFVSTAADDSVHRAAYWQNDQLFVIGTLGGLRSAASDVNDLGQFVGSSETLAGETRAFVWKSGAISQLPVPTESTRSTASSINNKGNAAGSVTIGGNSRAILWFSNHSYVTLPGLGGANAFAYHLNDSDQIIGSAQLPNGDYRRVIWIKNQIYDLTQSLVGWTNPRISSINNSGQIVGSGVHLGKDTAFVMTPVPDLQITGVVVQPGSTSVEVNWQTNLASDSTVEWGLTKSYGSKTSTSTLVTVHKATLTVKPGKLYHFRVSSTDSFGKRATTDDLMFTSNGETTGGDGRWSFRITRPSNGPIELEGSYTYKETGGNQISLNNASIVGSTLGAGSALQLPVLLGTILPGHTAQFVLKYPRSVGGTGARMHLEFKMTYTTSISNIITNWGEFDVVLP